MKKRKKTEVLNMKRVKEILRLRYELNMSQNAISRSCRVSRATVQDYLRRAEAVGLTREEALELSEEALEERLAKRRGRSKSKAELDYQYLQRELAKQNVTLALLWQEYIEKEPDGYCYAGFCNAYREWKKSTRVSMRQTHKAGDKLFVDFAGQTVPIFELISGNVRFYAEIFVAVLGASNYSYAEAVPSQGLKHWLGAHVLAFSFFGGVSSAVVPDNLKSGVKDPLYYDPELNPGYRELAEYYSVAILPARRRKPKDKAKVEVGVQVVQRWILAALRNRKFFSIEQLNEAISLLLEKLNSRIMKSYGCSRKELFESVEKEALKPLPRTTYHFFERKFAGVNIDYHVEVEKHFYSVPHQLVHEEVEVRILEKTIEIFYKGKRITLHSRSNKKFAHTTKKEHMPPSHQAMLEWTPQRFVDWAAKVGPETKTQVDALLNSRAYPEQGYRACLGLLRLSGKVGSERMEAACKRANQLKIVSMRRIKSMLDSGMDRLPLVEVKTVPAVHHANIRGGGYYN